jgi:hypothetical protein
MDLLTVVMVDSTASLTNFRSLSGGRFDTNVSAAVSGPNGDNPAAIPVITVPVIFKVVLRVIMCSPYVRLYYTNNSSENLN